jgi:hypothetical protein
MWAAKYEGLEEAAGSFGKYDLHVVVEPADEPVEEQQRHHLSDAGSLLALFRPRTPPVPC